MEPSGINVAKHFISSSLTFSDLYNKTFTAVIPHLNKLVVVNAIPLPKSNIYKQGYPYCGVP
jgi:hypothetical protein